MKLATAALILSVVSSASAFSPSTPVRTHASPSTTALPMAGVPRNPNFAKLAGGYLFPEIGRRRTAYLEENPDMADRIISLGIGDTTMPIPEHILKGLVDGASKLGKKESYSGYGAEQGRGDLREKIASTLYGGIIEPDEVFVSDGAKCDIMRLQQMFGPGVTSAVQDPSYPVYVDTSVMMGQTGDIDESTSQYDNIVYMPCTAENEFFPDYASLPRADVVYFCSPNNPTGAAATKEQLEGLVKTCKERGSILVFDAAYAPFIRSEGVPKSIFEVEGARDCAIEVNSFSKYAGFTGVRLGWTVIPSDLKFADGTPVKQDFNRVMTTAFNGASNIVQNGGMACLDDDGMKEIDALIDYYLENAALLKEAMESIGYKVFGGTDAPYVFIQLPEGQSSWDAFSDILDKAQVVTIPGAGFGPGGEGYLRLSAFAPRDSVIEACKRLKEAMS
uniref:Aminotransferase class I/classII large domain-containing protein n=1 Tax=Odontella aurita TaxID=265563 RepID=A0A6U6DPL0_9STRA|mmetsp:Transcript_21517/g.63030  ORF Transcript_21517/g.63030 Transcript_21517/m.63030 type:complete len:447 (+) Transcript_21517:185-1525(+)|eukprot:CAMPEP_0113531896 /NCGR_PEP_ID=MMETSP0015_2-20120614/3750_1 /TAXON_ID=2838 /ORGANISM="Odontella" /LENGTH=446 /DNA_ID=CAMNT_0000430781 /DNA_START=107 /DNA_END=1447 /DNA_ORIENTATION=- /assembly_acc=CAM_ASM_000160